MTVALILSLLNSWPTWNPCNSCIIRPVIRLDQTWTRLAHCCHVNLRQQINGAVDVQVCSTLHSGNKEWGGHSSNCTLATIAFRRWRWGHLMSSLETTQGTPEVSDDLFVRQPTHHSKKFLRQSHAQQRHNFYPHGLVERKKRLHKTICVSEAPLHEGENLVRDVANDFRMVGTTDGTRSPPPPPNVDKFAPTIAFPPLP